jgi:hypothetical protein
LASSAIVGASPISVRLSFLSAACHRPEVGDRRRHDHRVGRPRVRVQRRSIARASSTWTVVDADRIGQRGRPGDQRHRAPRCAAAAASA